MAKRNPARPLPILFMVLAACAAVRGQTAPQAADSGGGWTTRWPAEGGFVSSLAVGPSEPAALFAGGSGGVFTSTDGGASWALASAQVSSASALALDPANTSTIYAGNASGLLGSSDGGAHFTPLSGIAFPVKAIGIDPATPSTLYAGGTAHLNHDGGAELSKSVDGGANWTAQELLIDSIASLLVDPRDSKTVFAGADYCCGQDYPRNVGLMQSFDGGTSWSISFRRDAADYIEAVPALAIDSSTGTVFAAVAGYSESFVFRNAGSGSPAWEWFALPIGARIASLVIDPAAPANLYVGTDAGVFRSADSGTTWSPMSRGLPNLSVAALAIDPRGTALHAATSSGVFDLALPAAAPSFPCEPAADRLCLLDGRFQVELLAKNPRTGRVTRGVAAPEADGFGYFSLPAFTGDAAFPEVLVKMVDAAAPWNTDWVFFGGLTDVGYLLTVTDTITGESRSYANDPAHPYCGGADTSAFQDVGSARAGTEAAQPLRASGDTLALLSGRFHLTLSATDPRTGRTAPGVAISRNERFGYFSLPDFTGDSGLPEVVVKMDPTSLPDTFWLFFTGLTDLSYVLTATEVATGAVRTYASPGAFCGGADTSAFHPNRPSPGTPDISGVWTGFFDTDDDADCESHVPVSLTLFQDADNVTSLDFTANDACGMGGRLEGTLHGTSFGGVVVKVGWVGGQVSGTASGSSLDLRVRALTQPLPGGSTSLSPGGTLTLSR